MTKTVNAPVFCDVCGEKLYRRVYIIIPKGWEARKMICRRCLIEQFEYKIVGSGKDGQ